MHIYGSSRIGIEQRNITYSTSPFAWLESVQHRDAGTKRYELTDHLGNVRVTISDLLVPRPASTFGYVTQDAEVLDRRDYYPFGMEMPGRRWRATTEGAGRYGFNGKENDNEVKGEGNQQDYGFRIYDPRVARFLSVDPLTGEYPWYTPYQFAGNRVINSVDLDGLEEWQVTDLDGNDDLVYGPYRNNDVAQESHTKSEILSDKRFRFLQVAGENIGVSETGTTTGNQKIGEYHVVGAGQMYDESVPWCSSFLNYCLKIGNPDYPRTNSASSSRFYLQSKDLGLQQVDVPYYGSLMLRDNDGRFDGGQGHVAIVVGRVNGGYAQLGGNQAVPGSPDGTTVNVVLRKPDPNVRYYHYGFLPRVPLLGPLFPPATKAVQPQQGTDR